MLRGELGVAEAARQHGVNESLIHTWKTKFLEAGRARLAGDRQVQGVTALERENDRLISTPFKTCIMKYAPATHRGSAPTQC